MSQELCLVIGIILGFILGVKVCLIIKSKP